MCNQRQAMAILGEVYASCKALFDNTLSEAYLYGSYARGDYHEESDVDILLTAEQTPERIAAFRKQIGWIASDLSLKHDVTISLTVKPAAQFRQYAEILPFYRNVLREGIRYAT